MLQHILVGLDGSPLAESILTYVSILARGLGADVTLLHVLHVPEYVRDSQLSAALSKIVDRTMPRAQAYLEGVQARLRGAGMPSSAAVVVGDAAAEIVSYAEREGLDLIALATHGRSGMQRWFHGSVADRVLHLTTVPLILVNPTTEWVAAPPAISEIIVPLDGSPLAEAVLPLAERLAVTMKAPVVLLRVVEMLNPDMYGPESGFDPVGYQRILEALREAAEGYLAQVAARLQENGVSVETKAPFGFPAITIVDYAHDHPGSVLLIGTHGRTGLVGFFLGSVARRVVQQVDVPVLVVRPIAAPDWS